MRGHHLICLHFFSGEGYDRAFTGNLESVVLDAETSPIFICSGPDDVCRKCPWLRDRVCSFSRTAEEDVGRMDRDALRLLDLVVGEEASWAAVRKLLPRIFHIWHESWCRDCDWRHACLKNEQYDRLLRNSL